MPLISREETIYVQQPCCDGKDTPSFCYVIKGYGFLHDCLECVQFYGNTYMSLDCVNASDVN